MLKLMYITNSPAVAEIADAAGVDRIFVDLEKVGKAERQRGWNSVKSQHSTEDIPKIKAAVRKAQVLVRTDPVFDGLGDELNEV
ncbi:MAG: aldolase, partial [Oscillospiraceae bacterium]|nr:aldolase [Oscillospiraceae bacterium]